MQTGPPRELAKLLTRATQPGLVSPGSGDQAQWCHPASLASESGESLRHMDATLASVRGEADRSVVMRSPCAGATLDPPLWIVLNQALSLSFSLSLSPRPPCPADEAVTYDTNVSKNALKELSELYSDNISVACCPCCLHTAAYLAGSADEPSQDLQGMKPCGADRRR